MILDAMERAGDDCNDRQAVIDEFFNTKGKEGVTGTYDIDEDGDVNLSQFGRHSVENGELSPIKTVQVKQDSNGNPLRLVRFASRGPGERPPGPACTARPGRRQHMEAATTAARAHAASASGDRAARSLDRPLRADRGPADPAGRATGSRTSQDEGDLSRLASNLKDGLSNGAIWALIALGYTLVYGIIQLINFAHGELFMIGSFTAVGLYGTVGLTAGNPVIGLAAGLLVVLRGHDDRLRGPQRDDRARRVPAVTQRAEARAADHGRRVLVHPPERRHPLARAARSRRRPT